LEHSLGDPQVGWRGLEHHLGDVNVGGRARRKNQSFYPLYFLIHRCQFPRGSGYTCSQHLVKMQKKKFSCDWKFN